MIDVGQIRMQSLMGGYDKLTPSRNRGESNVDNRGSFSQPLKQKRNAATYDPKNPEPEEAPTPGLAKLADVSVDPNKDTDEEARKFINAIQGSYNPDVTSRDRYNRLLEEFPQRHVPTKTDRFIAAGYGLNSKDPAKTIDETLQRPYYRGVAEWKEKAEPFYKAAQLEGTANTQERQVVANALTGFGYGRRTDASIRANDQKYNLGVEALRIKDFIATHPNWKVDFTGPKAIAYNPANPTRDYEVMGDTGKIPERERLLIQRETGERIARIRATATTESARIRAEAAVKRAGTTASRATPKLLQDSAGNLFKWDGDELEPQGDSPDEPDGSLFTITGKPREPVDKPMSPQAEKVDTQNTLAEIYANEQDARDYIIRGNNGQYYFDERPESSYVRDRSAAQARYDALRKRVFPNYVPVPSGSTPTPPAAPPVAPPPTPTPPGVPTPTPLASADPARAQRAEAWLRSQGKRPSPAAIEWAIRKGYVK